MEGESCVLTFNHQIYIQFHFGLGVDLALVHALILHRHAVDEETPVGSINPVLEIDAEAVVSCKRHVAGGQDL